MRGPCANGAKGFGFTVKKSDKVASSNAITRLIDRFYIGPLRHLLPLRTFRYGVCGGTNMLLDALLYHLVYHAFGQRLFDLGFAVISSHIAALAIVFPITFFNGFLLNKYVAFRGSALPGGIQLGRYVLSVAGSVLITYGSMKLLVEAAHLDPTLSKMLTTLITVCYSYLMQKNFTFRGCTHE